MFNKIKIASKYIRHYWKSNNRHGIHSPFVYHFLEDILYVDNKPHELDSFIALRESLLKDTREINITDLGAGSTINSSKTRLVKDVAKNSSKHSKYGRLFYRIVKHYQPANCIELGTSLGLSTIYFAKASSNITIHSLEGCPNTLKIAQENFDSQNLSNIHTYVGDFKETLPVLLDQIQKLGLVFFDGNHQEQATLDYFEWCLPYVTEKTIFIFDDIHWSEGMTKAWNKIKGHPKTVVTLDLFFLGIVFFDTRLTPQEFNIRF